MLESTSFDSNEFDISAEDEVLFHSLADDLETTWPETAVSLPPRFEDGTPAHKSTWVLFSSSSNLPRSNDPSIQLSAEVIPRQCSPSPPSGVCSTIAAFLPGQKCKSLPPN